MFAEEEFSQIAAIGIVVHDGSPLTPARGSLMTLMPSHLT